MQCIKRKTGKSFIFDSTDIINISKTGISFKIQDCIKCIYYCKLSIQEFLQIMILEKEPTISIDDDNKYDYVIKTYNNYVHVKSIENGFIVIKIFYNPLRMKVCFLNKSILKINFFKKPRETVCINTTFYFINHLYGLAERASHSRLACGKTYRLHNTDEFLLALKSDKPLYGSIPFIVGSCKDHSIGLLWKNESDTRVEISKLKGFITGSKTCTKWHSVVGDSELVCFVARNSCEIHKLLMSSTGNTPLPPLFALGYHQCRWNYDDQGDVLMVDASMDKAGIPYDVIWLDIEHTDGKRYMTWDTAKFNPKELIEHLKTKNRHLVVIIDPHLKVDDEYIIYQEAKANGYLVKNDNGSIFIGQCWPSDSAWVDYINDEACLWWSKKISDYLKNFDCSPKSNNLWVWNDMNEPSVFNSPDNQMNPNAKHAGNIDHRNVHNIYGQRMAKSTWDGILNATDKQLRPFLLSRSFYTGSQKYGAIWTGDSEASWNHLQICVAMMISLSMCGIDFCGSDVGGFFGDPDSELLTRWYQLGALQPFFRAHSHQSSKRREPYLLEEPYGSIIRKTILYRYQILAYWYLCFWLADTYNESVISPVWMYCNSYRYIDNDDMFMVGSSILFRPIVTPGCRSITTTLPGIGKVWYHYCNISSKWQMYYGERKHKIDITLESMPVFYIGGSCIFMKEETCSNTVDWQKLPYSVYVFPIKHGKSTGFLYIDDYCSYAYKDRKSFYLFQFTFDPVDKSMTYNTAEKTVDNTALTNPKIKNIIIIKNKSVDWSGYDSFQLNESLSLEQCRVTHFDDRIEISNLDVDIMASNVIRFL